MKGQIIIICLAIAGLCGSFHAQAQLKAGFSANTVSGCSPLVVQFKDASTGSPTSWKWDLGNGTTSLFQHPSTVYFNPGTYTVKLVIKNAAGADSIEKQQYITVNDNPVAVFTASDSIGCFPFPVQFSDKSTVSNSTINQWKWDFGDGDTSNLQYPLHTYTGTGNYTVTLKVTSAAGCTKTISKPQHIKITSGVKAGFELTAATTSCSAPVDINFVNTSVEAGAVSYRWDFGDGNTSADKNPQHRYTSNGSYTVTLIAVNATGCSDTVRKTNVLVLGNSITKFSVPDSVCANQPFTLINNSTPTPASVQWNFGDGTFSTEANPQKAYATAGNFTVQLVNQFGACTDAISKTIKVLPQPTADFSSNRTYSCSIPATIRFTSSSSAAVSYSWDFGDGQTSTLPNPVHTYINYGSYDVRLIVSGSNGCTDTIVKKAHIRVEPPKVQINNMPVKGCVPFTVPFTSSVTVEDNVTGYRWDFGDGATSTHATPSHTYSKEGSYTVKLVITTAGGCTDSIVLPNAVIASPVPKADFKANVFEVCSSNPVQFTNQSIPAGDKWEWKISRGSTITEPNHTYNFSDSGYFDVTLIVSNNGCADTIVKKNYIHVTPPFARYNTTLDCADKFTRQFHNKSLAAQSWTWNFGDGTTSTDYSPTHTYAKRGIYEVTLHVKNNGCEETSYPKRVVVADEHPDFTADKAVVCKGEPVAFTTQQVDPQYISKLHWIFGDGATSDVNGNVNHIYTQAGVYKVSLVFTDANGCVDSVVKQQYIRVNGPTVAFAVQQQKICIQATANFDDQSVSDGTHPITSWTWNYGDGTTQTYGAAPYAHTYQAGNSYDVTLKVIDNNGCADSITKAAVVIVSDPKADFVTADTSSCPGKPINFSNTSTGSGLQYRWNFGDGQTATQATPAHQYQLPGRYTVNLWISDPLGCRDSIARTNYIRITVPVAKFSMSDSVGNCPPLQVQFTNEANNYTSVKWEFGDGSVSTLENPVHFYNVPGTYYAKQIIEVPGGCTDVLTKKIIVKGPSGSFTYNPTTGCAPLKVQFNATGNGIASLVWDFNDGSTEAATSKSTEYIYNTAGKFVPRMVLIDSAGCQVPVAGADTINAIGVVAKAAMDTYRICDAGNIQFTDQSVANDFITGHYWNFGDGKTSTLANPQHAYAHAPATYTVTHIVTTANGCKDTLHMADTVKVFAVPQVAIKGDSAACTPAQLNFQAAVTGDAANAKLHWDFGNGQMAGSKDSVTQSYSQAGDYKVQVQLLYQDYCQVTAHRNVTIWPLPNTSAGKDTFVCRDSPMPLHATGADRYTWNSTSDISCTNCAVAMINPVDNTTYTVTGYSLHGCIKKDSIHVRVRQRFDMKVLPGDTLCAGQNMKLVASGAEQYQWYPSTGLDNPMAAAPKAMPATTTTYTVVGRDSDHCFTDTGIARVVVYPVPQIFAGRDTTINTGNTMQLNTQSSADITKWSWAPSAGLSCTSCPKPIVTVKGNVSYRVQVSNEGGCTAEDDVNIVAVCNESNWFLPNTFSPNNDGANDVFYVRGKGLHRIHALRIFNRWGQAIFEKRDFSANDPAAGWDGTFNGKPVDMDVYVYIIEVICDNSSIVPYKGNIALIR
jgi:gliding motility-associated-like protein